MRKIYYVNSFRRFSQWIAGYTFLFIFVFGSNVFGQETKTVTRQSGTTTMISTLEVIPDVSESCVTIECNWWRQLRAAAGDLQQKGNIKSKRKFVEVFLVGLENNYRVPIADRSPIQLASGMAIEVPKLQRPRNGEVEISLEVRADGSVGEVTVVKGLMSELDTACVRSFKENIYLPAVKDGSWVSDSIKTSCKFWSAKGY